MFGQTIVNNDWKVWTPDTPGGIGAKVHPEACRPGSLPAMAPVWLSDRLIRRYDWLYGWKP